MINFELLKNPINWIIVILMLLIAAMAGTYAATLLSSKDN